MDDFNISIFDGAIDGEIFIPVTASILLLLCTVFSNCCLTVFDDGIPGIPGIDGGGGGGGGASPSKFLFSSSR